MTHENDSSQKIAPRRTQRERREMTVQRVVDAAMELIAAGGSRTLTLAEVGRAAGYSRGIVTHHFGTKEALIQELAQTAQAKFTFDEPDLHGLDRLVARVQAYLRSLRTHQPAGQAFLLMWAEAVASEPALRPIFVERDQFFREEITKDIREGIDNGSIRPEVDPVAMSLIIVGNVRGMGLQLMLTPPDAPSDTIEAQVSDFLRRGLGLDS